MAFDGFRKFFNRIGGLTIDSSRRVGEGVQAPVDRMGDVRRDRIRSNIRSERKSALDSETKYDEKSDSKSKDSKPLLGTESSSRPLFNARSDSRQLFRPSKSSPRTIKRMRMDKEEIEMFKELIDKKYEPAERTEEEQKNKETLRKASLEEILKAEQRETLDPRLIIVIGGVSFAVVVVAIIVLGFGIEIGLIFGILVLMMAIFIIFLPNMRRGRKTSEAARELPFALRQMATELRAGIGLHDSMRSVATSGYGPLSEEFSRALEEIRYGETTEKALIDMSERINSEGLQRAVYQITRTLASGGDLAKTLGVIADDTAYELRMKLKDYSQKLNSFTMIYMFLAILFPVITMIMLIAASTVMGAIIPPILLLIMFLFFFPMIVIFMAFMIKRLEPKI